MAENVVVKVTLTSNAMSKSLTFFLLSNMAA